MRVNPDPLITGCMDTSPWGLGGLCPLRTGGASDPRCGACLPAWEGGKRTYACCLRGGGGGGTRDAK